MGANETLDTVEWVLAQDVTRWTAGVGACGYAAARLATLLANYKRIPWARSKGLTEEMHFRFNVALWLFFLVALTGGALNMIADIKDLNLYHRAYKPLHVLLAIVTATLIVGNYLQMIWRGFQQQKVGRILGRLQYAYKLTSSRGVNLLELVFIPVAFFFPWIGAVQYLRPLIDAT